MTFSFRGYCFLQPNVSARHRTGSVTDGTGAPRTRQVASAFSSNLSDEEAGAPERSAARNRSVFVDKRATAWEKNITTDPNERNIARGRLRCSPRDHAVVHRYDFAGGTPS